jgi:WD40 repeat protein
MGQRLRVVGWLRFGNKSQLGKGLTGFLGRAPSEYFNETAWQIEGLDAHLALDTELAGDFTEVDRCFVEMIQAAAFGYVDYFEEGDTHPCDFTGKPHPVRRWAVNFHDRKFLPVMCWLGLGFPAGDTAIEVTGAYDFADEKAAAAAVAGGFRLSYLTAQAVRELRLDRAITLAGSRVTLAARIQAPWTQVGEPLIEVVRALGHKATAGQIAMRGDRVREILGPKAKKPKGKEPPSPTAPLPSIEPVDPAQSPPAATSSTPAEKAPAGEESKDAAQGKGAKGKGAKGKATAKPAGAVVLEAGRGSGKGAVVLSDGRLITWGDTQASLWSLPEGALLHTFSTAKPGEGGWMITGVTEVAPGKVAAFHESDGDIELLDLEGRDVQRLVGHRNTVLGLVGLADRMLSWSHDRTVRAWSLAGEPLGTLVSWKVAYCRQFTLLDDGSFVLACDEESGRFRSDTGESIEPLGKISACHRLPGGRYLLENYGHFALHGGPAPLSFVIDEGNSHAIVPCGEGVLVPVRWGARFASLADGSVREAIKGHSKDLGTALPVGDGLWVTHGRSMPGLNERFGFDGTLKTWAEGSWDEVASCDLKAPIAQALPLRGGRVALRLDDALRSKEIPLVDARSGRLLTTLKGPKKAVLGLRELPDGQLLAWSKDGSTRLFDLT